MVVTVQSPCAECTAIATMCIVAHRPPPCAVKIYKTRTDERGNEFQDSAPIQDQRSICQPSTSTNTLILTNRPRIDRGEHCNDHRGSNSCRNGEHFITSPSNPKRDLHINRFTHTKKLSTQH